MYKTTVFIFRRDLRIEDNTGLLYALKNSDRVIPCFILNPEQLSETNSYRSHHAIEFMFNSLIELDLELRKKGGKLYLFKGLPEDILMHLIKEVNPASVMVNRDYTPYSRSRDATLEKICADNNIFFESLDDAILIKPEDGLNKQGRPYTIFTPFFKNNRLKEIPFPQSNIYTNYATQMIPLALDTKELVFPSKNNELYVKGGRIEGLSLLNELKSLESYEVTHNTPSLATSALSAHNKFGTVSIREVFHTLGKTLGYESPLIRQLYWRDFFTHIAWFFPHIFGHSFNTKYDTLSWNTQKSDFERWCTGTTGFPIVDAGMRQLNTTGFMHNRVRLIVGSFLVKDLHINWMWGEKYFAQQLTDYDPAVNNGNWQWVASTGCDHQPYFRIFNPWLQQKKFDPACTYIKKWIPELRDMSSAMIHSWYKQTKDSVYPKPMVDHTTEASMAKLLFKQATQRSHKEL